MILEYNEQTSYTKSISVNDIGNFALRCISDTSAVEYYYIVKTDFGKTAIVKIGPLLVDAKVALPGYSVVYTQIDYKESRIERDATGFINDPKKAITEVTEISIEEALSHQLILSAEELNA